MRLAASTRSNLERVIAQRVPDVASSIFYMTVFSSLSFLYIFHINV